MVEEKLEKIIELLEEIKDGINNVASECSSISYETSYISNLKGVAEEILEEVKAL